MKVMVSLFLLLLVSSCTSFLVGFHYQNMQIVLNPAGTGYLFPGSNPHRILVYLDGSGMNSVLGIRQGPVWISTGFLYYILRFFSGPMSVYVPEKPGMQPGGDYSSDDIVQFRYTCENLIATYASSIDAYLDETDDAAVCMLGFSEGGHLLPAVYNALRNKERIVSLVVIGAGGLSQAENFRILGQSPIAMPNDLRREYQRVDSVEIRVMTNPGSITDHYLGWTYRRWSGFFGYRPLDELGVVDIPILFVHGTQDWNSPVESVRAVEAEYPDAPMDYWYEEDMSHVPGNDSAVASLLRRILVWIDAGFQAATSDGTLH